MNFHVEQEICFVIRGQFVAGRIVEIHLFSEYNSRYITVELLDGRNIGFSDESLDAKIADAGVLMDELVTL